MTSESQRINIYGDLQQDASSLSRSQIIVGSPRPWSDSDHHAGIVRFDLCREIIRGEFDLGSFQIMCGVLSVLQTAVRSRPD
jgi:hypothetical protein